MKVYGEWVSEDGYSYHSFCKKNRKRPQHLLQNLKLNTRIWQISLLACRACKPAAPFLSPELLLFHPSLFGCCPEAHHCSDYKIGMPARNPFASPRCGHTVRTGSKQPKSKGRVEQEERMKRRRSGFLGRRFLLLCLFPVIFPQFYYPSLLLPPARSLRAKQASFLLWPDPLLKASSRGTFFHPVLIQFLFFPFSRGAISLHLFWAGQKRIKRRSSVLLPVLRKPRWIVK